LWFIYLPGERAEKSRGVEYKRKPLGGGGENGSKNLESKRIDQVSGVGRGRVKN